MNESLALLCLPTIFALLLMAGIITQELGGFEMLRRGWYWALLILGTLAGCVIACLCLVIGVFTHPHEWRKHA